MQSEALIRSLIQQDPQAPWAKSWDLALTARGGIPMNEERSGGLNQALQLRDFAPRLRPTDGVWERARVLAHLSWAAETVGAGEIKRFGGALKRFLALEVPFERLEHPELIFMVDVTERKPPSKGARVQLSWRSQAAAALLWALQLYPTLDAAADDEDGLSTRIETMRPGSLRPLEQIRAEYTALSEELTRTRRHSARHSSLLERKKALRWLTEPWWPEIATTPWRHGDTLNPRSPEQIEHDIHELENAERSSASQVLMRLLGRG